MPALDEDASRILVVVTRQIGDVLLTTPLIRAARRRWPAARIDVIGFAGTLGMLRGNPDVTELIEMPASARWKQSWPLIRRLWRRYDLAFVAQYSDRAHLIGWVAAGRRAGQVPAGPEGRVKRLLLRHAVDLGDDQGHAALEKLRLIAPWVGTEVPSKVVPPPGTPLPADVAARLAPRYAVIHAPSKVRYKLYPLPSYARVIDGLSARGVQVVLTGAGSPEDRDTVAALRALVPAAATVDACGLLDFNQLATLMAGAVLFIGPDTSVTHLATACGTPVIALYGPIDPGVWGPVPFQGLPQPAYDRSGYRQLRGNVVVLQGDQPCVPCNRSGCDRHDGSASLCLDTMAPERVLDEVARLLDA